MSRCLSIVLGIWVPVSRQSAVSNRQSGGREYITNCQASNWKRGQLIYEEAADSHVSHSPPWGYRDGEEGLDGYQRD